MRRLVSFEIELGYAEVTNNPIKTSTRLLITSYVENIF